MDHEIKAALLQEGCPLWHPTVLIRTQVLLSVGVYRNVMVDAEDYDLWLRIADRFQLANLQAIVLKYRRHSAQVSVRRFKQQALSYLAAQSAALSRSNGKPDPLNSVGEITPKVLAELGVSEARQQAAVARAYLTCIRSMSDAGESSLALTALNEILRSIEWSHAETSIIADFRLLAARVYWRQRKFARSILTAGHAVVTRPIMLGRPLKPLLRRLRLAFARCARLL